MKSKSQPQIIYEDEYLVAINKPPRVASVPGVGIPVHKTLMGMVQELFAKRTGAEQMGKPYILHRTDFHTSGVLLFGKNKKDRSILEGIFHAPETQKKYLALVRGIPTGRVITKKLAARSSRRRGNKTESIVTEIFAQTFYKIIKKFRNPDCTLVEAEIKTGRRHQIRQHFSFIGYPVILDGKYGDVRFNKKFRVTFRLGRQFLHAASLRFMHPIKKELVVIEAPLPPDLQSVVKKLNFGR